MKKALITAIAISLQISCAIAGVPLRFDADVRSTSTFQASAYRGETLDIRARLLDGAHPLPVPAGAEAAMLWQTNGMGTAWWSVPATVSTSGVVEATWTPTNDVGAASYRVFLGVAADGRNWRANLLLRLIDAPGASPNELEPPVRTLDFATVEVSNAPWLTVEADPVWEAEKNGYARTSDLGSAAYADTPRKYALDATNIVGITIQPLTTSDWGANRIGGFAISHPDYGSASLLFPDDFTETDGGWCGQIDLNRVAPFVPRPRRYGGVLITNLVFGGETATMTSSTVECSMDCFADWQGDSDNIHFVFYARSDRHDEWMSVGEAADLAASRAAVAATNYTDAAIAAIDIPDPDLSFTNDYARTESLGSAFVAATNHADEAVADLRDEIEAGWWSEWRYISHSDPYTPQQGRTLRYLGNNTWSFGRYVDGTWVSDDTIAAPENATSIYFVDRGDGVTATRRRVAAPVPTKADDIGAQPAGDYATPDDIADEIFAASNALARAWSADAALLSMLLQGSNVVAEVTNYNSQVRSPSLRLLQLNASNEYDVVWSELTNLSKVAQDASDHADAVAAAALNTSTNYAAPRAWSGTTSGLGAEAPEGWTWISTPSLAIGGGLEFEKHVTGGGAVWVLRNNGMVAQMNALTNNTAYLEISSLDGESVFRIEKTDAQTLGVDTARVSVDGSTLICGVDVVSASPPLVRLKTSLSQGEWVREEDGIPPSLADVQWEGESGAWVCRITNNSGGHSLFATMAVIQEGGTKIVPAAPMDAGAGILCTDGVHKVRPVYNNGAITWEIIQ